MGTVNLHRFSTIPAVGDLLVQHPSTTPLSTWRSRCVVLCDRLMVRPLFRMRTAGDIPFDRARATAAKRAPRPVGEEVDGPTFIAVARAEISPRPERKTRGGIAPIASAPLEPRADISGIIKSSTSSLDHRIMGFQKALAEVKPASAAFTLQQRVRAFRTRRSSSTR